jgi:hypothetical protein
MRFSPQTAGLRKFGTLSFIKSKSIIFRDLTYDRAVLEFVERAAVGKNWSYSIILAQGEIVVEAEDMVSMSWNIV